jgi:hypothetical protein
MAIQALLVYIIATYFPLIFTVLPLLGKLKIVLLAGVVLLVSFVANQNKYTNTTAHRNPIVYCWAVFLFLMILGIFGSFDRGRTLDLIELNFKYFLIFMVMIKVIDTPERFQKVLFTFTLCGVGMAMSTTYNYVFNIGGSADLTGGYRAIALESGVFADPNDLAVLLNSILPFAAYFLLVKEKKLFPLMGVLIIATGIILTHSRAGFLGLCVTGLTFMFLFGKNQKKYIFLFLGLTILLWSVAPDSYKERISTITEWEVDEETGKTGTRMDAWKIGMIEGLKRPILGVGAGSGVYVMGKSAADWHDIHNAFVQVFVDIGVPGFIAYLLLFMIPHKKFKEYRIFIKNIKDDPIKFDILHKIVMISLRAFAVTAFFTPQAYSPLLSTLTGITVIALELTKKEINLLGVSRTNLSGYPPPIGQLRGARL